MEREYLWCIYRIIPVIQIYKELNTTEDQHKADNHILKNGQPEDMNRHFQEQDLQCSRHIKDTQHHQCIRET